MYVLVQTSKEKQNVRYLKVDDKNHNFQKNGNEIIYFRMDFLHKQSKIDTSNPTNHSLKRLLLHSNLKFLMPPKNTIVVSEKVL